MTTPAKKKYRRPFNAANFMEVGLGIFLIVVIGLLLLGFYPVSHPRLTKKIVELVKKGGLDSCTIGNVTVAVWKGVSFHQVALTGTTGEGDRYELKASVITLKCNLFMLGIKYRKIRSLILATIHEFQGLKKSERDDPARVVKSVLHIVGESGYIKGMVMSGAEVSVGKKKVYSFVGKGIEIGLAFPLTSADKVNGSLAVGSLSWSNDEIARHVNTEFSYDSGVIAIQRCKAMVLKGRVKLETKVNVEKQTLSGFSIAITDLDLGELSRLADSNDGHLSGRADLRFALDSSCFNVDSLRGKGTLSVSRFEIVDYPFQKSLVTMLMYPGLKHLSFKKFKADLNLKPGKIVETDAVGEGDTLSLKTDGWIRTDGLLNEKLECTLTKAGVNTLPEFAQKTLEDAPGGGRTIRCRIYGMIQNPKVSVESKVILQKAVKNMFEEVRNNLQLWMR